MEPSIKLSLDPAGRGRPARSWGPRATEISAAGTRGTTTTPSPSMNVRSAQHAVSHGPWLLVAQELMVGHPVTELGPALVEDLLALHPGRLGLAEPDPADRWGIDQIEILVSGGHGYCLQDDYATVGDAAFDLVLLAVGSLDAPCDEETRHRLMEAALGGLDVARRQAYIGNLLLRLLDWPIRRNRPEEIEFWLARADSLLDGS